MLSFFRDLLCTYIISRKLKHGWSLIPPISAKQTINRFFLLLALIRLKKYILIAELFLHLKDKENYYVVQSRNYQ